jgi:tRNA-intron endonuclease|tara:strand:- start:11669 stop:12160 length:492 start_codon:yes stop_codon:yes gene_type:complete
MEKGTLIGNKVVLSTSSLFDRSVFGTLNKQGGIELSSEEALYLVEKKKIDVDVSFDNLRRRFNRSNKNFEERYAVFRDLRNRGYILKSGLKFGCDFRVYDKGSRPGKTHAKWLVFSTKENSKSSWKEMSGMARVANSTKKNVLVGIVDSENGVSYFEVSWRRP